MSNTKRGQEYVKTLMNQGKDYNDINLDLFRIVTEANHLSDSQLRGNLRRCISKIKRGLI